MKLGFEIYKDKVMGCWLGKNIGGVLGAPFEARRQMNQVDFYTQDLSQGPPPNDDLDLQIVWLAAVERYGRQVNAAILGEYWLSYVTPNWVEYGVGKANLTAGLAPPLSGRIGNRFGNSCGCFIRSEIWACLSPGRPDLAVRYAYEDAIVDHHGEGMYGEVFCAALQSAAFVERDPRTLIAIALSYVPADSALARCVQTALRCHENKMDIAEARVLIHNEAPGTFGVQWRETSQFPTDNGRLAHGTPGFDCPENVAYMIAGWLYGEGDFGKSLCAAVSFGEDTDCTAATLGATLGILCGASGIPPRWAEPLNDKISTMCINRTSNGVWVPQTTSELADRVLRVTPLFLGPQSCDLFSAGGYTIDCAEGEGLYCPQEDYLPHLPTGVCPRQLSVADLVRLPPHVVRHDFTNCSVMIDYGGEPFFAQDTPYALKVIVANNDYGRQQMWCKLRACVPEGVRVISGTERYLQLNTTHGDQGEAVFQIDASDYAKGRMDVVIDIHFEGRHSYACAKAVLYRAGAF